MDKDFHYEITYIAATIAGFDQIESEQIATYAQFVDDCTPELVKEKGYTLNNKEYKFIATCSDGIKQSLGTKRLGRHALWIPFHFLPGNFTEMVNGSTKYVIKYEGREEDKDYWYHNPDDFKLLCLPKSYLSKRMVRKITLFEYEADWAIYQQIGIMAHVLADTVAHAFYTGKGDWTTNEVIGDVYRVMDTHKEKINFGISHKENTQEEHTPWVPWRKSRVYTGHGRTGHIPDYGYVNYRYIPQWKTKSPRYVVEIEHNKTFLFAFKLLVQALYCAKYNLKCKHEEREKDFIHFEFKEYIDYSYNGYSSEEVLHLLSEYLTDEIGLYHVYAENVKMRSVLANNLIAVLGLAPLREYNVENVINYEHDFKAFNYAALKHFMYVREKLQRAKFRVFDVFGSVVKEDEISTYLNEQYGTWSPGEEGDTEENNLDEKLLKRYGEDMDLQYKKFYEDLDVENGKVDESLKKFFEFGDIHISNPDENHFINNSFNAIPSEKIQEEL